MYVFMLGCSKAHVFISFTWTFVAHKREAGNVCFSVAVEIYKMLLLSLYLSRLCRVFSVAPFFLSYSEIA